MRKYNSYRDAISALRKKDPEGFRSAEIDVVDRPPANECGVGEVEKRINALFLSSLKGIIREHRQAVDKLAGNMSALQLFNPFRRKSPAILRRISKPLSDDTWGTLGIRRLILDQAFSPVSQDPWFSISGDGHSERGGWPEMKNEALTSDIEDIFSCCMLIEFADWAGLADASGFWDGLYLDVIKRLGKRDFRFIFHLGDVSKRGVFEIDEAIDIISEYSSYGKVTLILHSQEADSLWNILNGRSAETSFTDDGLPTSADGYSFLFDRLTIETLLILQDDQVFRLCHAGQEALAGRTSVGRREASEIRHQFAVGYQIGALLELDALYCMALGHAVVGAYVKTSSGPVSAMLLTYLDEWINDVKAI